MAAKHLGQIMTQAPKDERCWLEGNVVAGDMGGGRKILLIYTMKCSKHFFGAVFLDDGADTSVL